MNKYYDVELAYNSNTIEGNTLTRIQTKLILEDRDECMNALEKASVNNDYTHFIEIIEKAVDGSLDMYLLYCWIILK